MGGPNQNAILYSSEVYYIPTQSDTVDLPEFSRQIRCGAGGNLHVLRIDGVEVTITGILAGEKLDIVAKRIFDTGTTIADADLLVLA